MLLCVSCYSASITAETSSLEARDDEEPAGSDKVSAARVTGEVALRKRSMSALRRR